ncbi:MAG: quinol dehydrogenase ferredoxin subunit NapH [Betaproteobacteria bacterium]|nr:quinol dehydrogenase ferredoxin subunit NapH [Betaproteobacteria bacterium]
MNRPGADAIAEFGWFWAHRWLILRRVVQVGILLLFMLTPLATAMIAKGDTRLPWASLKIVKGNLAYSLTLDTLPLTDPYVALQSLVSGHLPETLGIVGVLIVLVFYFLVGGRVYCSWVCPINIVTDLAAALRRRLNIKGSAQLHRSARFWMLAMTLILSALTGTVIWELLNPVSMMFRGLVFGIGAAWMVVLAVFLFDLFVMSRGWCSRLCPVGAFYSLIGHWSPLRISASKRAACNDCMDCFEICPEPQVIRPALKGEEKGLSPVILASACTNCGRCIDVCSKDVFKFGTRFARSASLPDAPNPTNPV